MWACHESWFRLCCRGQWLIFWCSSWTQCRYHWLVCNWFFWLCQEEAMAYYFNTTYNITVSTYTFMLYCINKASSKIKCEVLSSIVLLLLFCNEFDKLNKCKEQNLIPPPMINHKNIGFLCNAGKDPTKLPSQHSMLGHHRPASERSFQGRFDGGPMVAHL